MMAYVVVVSFILGVALGRSIGLVERARRRRETIRVIGRDT